MYRVGSLFSGAGGLDWGFASAGGFSIQFANDILEHAGRTYSLNFGLPVEQLSPTGAAGGRAFYVGDVRLLRFSSLERVDVLIGGPPCQDFSVVRGPEWDRLGLEGAKGALLAEMVRAAEALQPEVVVFENVPGLLSANGRSAFHVVRRAFEEAGLCCAFAEVLDASSFGVPQRRRRLVAVFLRRSQAVSSAHAILRQRLSGGSPLLRRFPLTPLEAFEGRPLPELAESYRRIMEEYYPGFSSKGADAVSDYIKLNRIEVRGVRELEEAFKQHEAVLKEMGWLSRPVRSLSLPDGSCEVPREAAHVVERMKRIPPGKNHESVRGTDWEVEGRGISLVYRRIHPLKPAYTVVAYGGGGTWGYHYERSRSKLTHRERARLQSFPDSFLFVGSAQQVRAQIGEAVPPLMARAIAEACREVLAELATGCRS